MSGGSYSYLHCKSVGEVLDSGDLERMAKRLDDIPGAEEAARRTWEILDSKLAIQERIDRLGPVWKAVEWLDSGDWDMDEVKESLQRYREKT